MTTYERLMRAAIVLLVGFWAGVLARGWLLPWFGGVLLVAATGCTVDVNHHFAEGVEVSVDECLRCFPECGPGGEPTCRDAYAGWCTGCRVTCLGGIELTCIGEPRCWNRGLDRDVEVPVICEAIPGAVGP